MLKEPLLKTKNFLRNVRNYQKIPNWYWVDKIPELNMSFNDVEVERGSDKLFLKPLDIYVEKEKYDFLLERKALNQAKFLKKKLNAKFTIDKNDELIVELEGIKVNVQTAEELSILWEIFWLGIYTFIYDRPVVMLDIGMNVGLASLYFASQENVKSIWGYEPFQVTYEQALHNFDLNPDISQKIKPLSYGVAAEEKKVTVEFDYELRGSIGSSEDRTNNKQNKSLPKEELTLKPISEELNSIISQHPDMDIVAKIDCEGAEYEIFDSLVAKGQLNQIKVIMMEWHSKGPDKLAEYLRQEGFAIFSRLPRSSNIGAIYAVRA
ncbi:FkbM family methyltransferase [Okeania sp. SIO2B3]|uniref:FkbM family methyltransferase n=1 Tax=Okeania sp. SIO2B3 TaxID=2607784 RepID=UPI0026012D6E|nr:FkbM family methyltransferase [Okeania sp. SIO2B3]